MFADWARPLIEEHQAPHPLRQDFARAWLLLFRPVQIVPLGPGPDAGTKIVTPDIRTDEVFQRMLRDAGLVNLALGSLFFDLDQFLECFVAARPLLRAEDEDLHLRVMGNLHGGKVRDRLRQLVSEQGQVLP
jgi:hypothetical protein